MASPSSSLRSDDVFREAAEAIYGAPVGQESGQKDVSAPSSKAGRPTPHDQVEKNAEGFCNSDCKPLAFVGKGLSYFARLIATISGAALYGGAVLSCLAISLVVVTPMVVLGGIGAGIAYVVAAICTQSHKKAKEYASGGGLIGGVFGGIPSGILLSVGTLARIPIVPCGLAGAGLLKLGLGDNANFTKLSGILGVSNLDFASKAALDGNLTLENVRALFSSD